MPFIRSNNADIYYETMGRGSPLFLYHGLGDSSRGWYEMGYVAALIKRHKLILIDGRGHGQSQKLLRPVEYRLENCAADVINIANHLDIDRFDFFGCSMGGRVGLGLADLAPQRLNRLIVNGSHGFAQDMSALRDLLNSSIERWADYVSVQAGLSEVQRSRLLDNDVTALRAALVNDRPDMSASLTNIVCPCLLLVGSEDPLLPLVRKTAQRIFDSQLVELQGCNHFSAITDTEAVMNHLNLFFHSQLDLLGGTL